MAEITSIESYKILKDRGLLAPKQLEVYRLLAKKGSATVNELTYGTSRAYHKTQTNFHARINELRKMGIVKVVGKRPCAVTEIKCLVFSCNGHNLVKKRTSR